jgi:hypothetical protein
MGGIYKKIEKDSLYDIYFDMSKCEIIEEIRHKDKVIAGLRSYITKMKNAKRSNPSSWYVNYKKNIKV